MDTVYINGKSKEMEYLGSGIATAGFRDGDWVYLFTNDRMDSSKKVLSTVDTKNPHTPKVRYVGTGTSSEFSGTRSVYKTRYSYDLSAHDAPSTPQFQSKASLARQLQSYVNGNYRGTADTSLEPLLADKHIPASVRRSFKIQVEAFVKAGYQRDSIMFDFHEFNAGVDKEGNLIVRDAFVVG